MKIIKNIEVLVKIDADWINKDQSANLEFFIGEIFDDVKIKIDEAVIGAITKNLKIPKIKISKKELKAKVLDLMAERALEHD